MDVRLNGASNEVAAQRFLLGCFPFVSFEQSHSTCSNRSEGMTYFPVASFLKVLWLSTQERGVSTKYRGDDRHVRDSPPWIPLPSMHYRRLVTSKRATKSSLYLGVVSYPRLSLEVNGEQSSTEEKALPGFVDRSMTTERLSSRRASDVVSAHSV